MLIWEQALVTGQRFLICDWFQFSQVQESVAPPSADYHWNWMECRKNYARCSSPQIQYLQGN